MGIPRVQYHSTKWENVDLIRKGGLLLPGEIAVETHRYEIPSISTSDHPKYACSYHPDGALVVTKLRKGARYINRSIRNMRTDENLEEAVERWLHEAAEEGASGVYVGVGLQSTVGNQTIDLEVLEIVDIRECSKGS